MGVATWPGGKLRRWQSGSCGAKWRAERFIRAGRPVAGYDRREADLGLTGIRGQFLCGFDARWWTLVEGVSEWRG